MDAFQQLQQEVKLLQDRLLQVAFEQRSAIIKDIRQKMDAYGIDMSELGGKTKGTRGRRKGATSTAAAQKEGQKEGARRGRKMSAARKGPKRASSTTSAMQEVRYKDPQSGATWSGRGRQPGWIKGKNKEEFAVRH